MKPVQFSTIAALGLTVGLTLSSCQSLKQIAWWNQNDRLQGVGFEIKITPTQKPGVYTIVGTTPLPDKTPLRVSALRYLHPATANNRALNPRPTYSVLDYQAVQVDKGHWQTTLNLWRVAPTGEFQEVWQIEQQKNKLPLKPDAKVMFLATVTPNPRSDLITNLEQELAQQNQVLNSQQLRVTADGQRYLQVSQDQTVELPTGSTTPPPLKPEDINGGWGRRYLIPPEPRNPTRVELPENRRTNAAPAEEEFLR